MSKRNSEDMKSGTEPKRREETRSGSGSEKRLSAGQPSALKKPKLAFSIGKKPTQATKAQIQPEKLKPIKSSLREAFNSDSEEEEEMPPEARMRMRNMGRDTPTSAGPNSFGKTKQGFCDAKKVFEKKLKAAAEGSD